MVKNFHLFNNRREPRTYHEVLNTNLFQSRDDQWKKVRTITNSAFTTGKMKKMYASIRSCLSEYLEFMTEVANSGRAFNVKQMHENLTMDVFACCAFGTKTNSIKDPNNELIKFCRKIFNLKASKVIPAFVLPKLFNKLLNVKSFFDEDANRYIIGLCTHIIEKRRKSGGFNNDFLQLLMEAKIKNEKNDTLDESLDESLNDDFHLNDGRT